MPWSTSRRSRKPTAPSFRSYPAPDAGWLSPEQRVNGWEVVICGDLTERQSDLMQTFVELPRGSRGTIFFDSCGGSAYVGLAIAAMIRLRGLQPVAVVAGECSSAAILPFAACRTRYVTAHASLLFHPIRWQSDEQVKLEEAVEWARHFQLMEADHDQLMAKFFECSEELIAGWNRPGRFLSGDELVLAGLAKKIDLFSGDIWTQIAQSERAAS